MARTRSTIHAGRMIMQNRRKYQGRNELGVIHKPAQYPPSDSFEPPSLRVFPHGLELHRGHEMGRFGMHSHSD
ncbi:hypothetical protein WG66_004658 [Moniliophthora roreri]|nr:hypothetical protein WG66_004658 [Moniliophthora roreri]